MSSSQCIILSTLHPYIILHPQYTPPYISILPMTHHPHNTTQHDIRYIPTCHRYDASFLCGYPYTSSVIHYPTLLIIHHPSYPYVILHILLCLIASSSSSTHPPCMYSSIILLHIILPMNFIFIRHPPSLHTHLPIHLRYLIT